MEAKAVFTSATTVIVSQAPTALKEITEIWFLAVF